MLRVEDEWGKYREPVNAGVHVGMRQVSEKRISARMRICALPEAA